MCTYLESTNRRSEYVGSASSHEVDAPYSRIDPTAHCMFYFKEVRTSPDDGGSGRHGGRMWKESAGTLQAKAHAWPR